MNPPVDESLAALTGLLSLVLFIALYVWTALALSAMFRKMGEEPWKGWVPFLNVATVLRWGGFSPWLVLLSLIPVVQIAVFVLVVISAHRINPGFGYGSGMTVLAALLFVVWASILGFGPARWLGARAARRGPAPAPVAAPPAAPPVARVVSIDGVPLPPLPSVSAADAERAAAHSAPAAPSGAVGAGDAAFAPRTSAAPAWTPPETSPRAASATPSSAAEEADQASPFGPRRGAAPQPPAADHTALPADVSAGHRPLGYDVDADAAWPSEIDDVSAIHPSPFPPSSASGRPYTASPAPVADVGADSGPIAFVPGRRTGAPAPLPPAPVADVPASFTSASSDADESVEPFAPARSRRTFAFDDPDAFPELSGEVSAIVGAPVAGAPRSATGAVSAQHRRAESGDTPLESPSPAAREPVGDALGDGLDDESLDDESLDQTIITRRAPRTTWELVPASGAPVPITADVVILGRRPAPDAAYPTAQLVPVVDDARTVSKTHARIEQRGDAWIVTDLGSTNGVMVRTLMGDEVEVEPGGQLDAGERFFLGDEEFHLRRITQ